MAKKHQAKVTQIERPAERGETRTGEATSCHAGIRSTRLWFTFQPSFRKSPVIIRYP